MPNQNGVGTKGAAPRSGGDDRAPVGDCAPNCAPSFPSSEPGAWRRPQSALSERHTDRHLSCLASVAEKRPTRAIEELHQIDWPRTGGADLYVQRFEDFSGKLRFGNRQSRGIQQTDLHQRTRLVSVDMANQASVEGDLDQLRGPDDRHGLASSWGGVVARSRKLRPFTGRLSIWLELSTPSTEVVFGIDAHRRRIHTDGGGLLTNLQDEVDRSIVRDPDIYLLLGSFEAFGFGLY